MSLRAPFLTWSSQSSRNKRNCPPQFYTRILFLVGNIGARFSLPHYRGEMCWERISQGGWPRVLSTQQGGDRLLFLLLSHFREGMQPWHGPLASRSVVPSVHPLQNTPMTTGGCCYVMCLTLLMDSKPSQANKGNQMSQSLCFSPCLFLVTGSMRITRNHIPGFLFKNVFRRKICSFQP